MASPQPDEREPRDDSIPDWVEKVAAAAGALGFNKVRVRWKLQRWVNRRRAAARQEEQAAAHVQYRHRVCPHCRAVSDRDATTCTRCGKPLGSRAIEVLGRLGIISPRALSVGTLLGVIVVAAYVRVMGAFGGGVELPIEGLVAHGGSLPLDQNPGEWWRATTSVLLHAGLWHLAFNLFALASIGPVAEDRFGKGITLLLFVVTGTFASVISAMLGPPAVGVGASGAIMGLVGAVAGAGHRAGTSAGRAERDDMIKWVIYVFIFGLIVGADHIAHGAGFVAGGAFGLFVPTRALTRARARGLQLAAGGLAFVALAAATVAVLVPLQESVTLTHEWRDAAGNVVDDLGPGWPTDDPGDPDDVGTMLWICSDRPTAEDIEASGGQAAVREICAELAALRVVCRDRAALPVVAPTAADEWLAIQCGQLQRLDGKWPPPR